ncbi:AraC-like DNA-binding protein [Chryseobacterium sp. H1D6B]|uniref:helix-turn-helix domain-containing protein n=1 Tax=Chryseobacterium sp. H1D6B TaxID=2940588 RepID=UPI0015C7605D|nr:DUF6597 domain-containing transcriptional factor [Chryseobacterium sp. H1D6B]MDH6251424.1 AraC-like DNA-binding protein [Chryseobacterium sp. H1D6B]
MTDEIEYKLIEPEKEISGFVESFWMLCNHSDEAKETVILPDGRIDLIFSQSLQEPFHIILLGIETMPEQVIIPPKTIMFAVSFKLLAVEYILQESIAGLLGNAKKLNDNFWDLNAQILNDFDSFHKIISQKLTHLLPQDIDHRKEKLFTEIYLSEGEVSIKELSEKIGWNSRQINRYFTKEFGLSLKSYCGILRFRGSFGHIKQGKLFPEKNFSDQAHFIKEVKKLAGVSPKELFKNQNDRFIQFSTLS